MCTPEDPVMVRSVIQPDADMIIWVSPEVLKDTSIWQTHLDQVRAKFNFAYRLRMAIQMSWFLSPLAGLFGIVISLVERDYLPLLYSLGIGLLVFMVRIGLIAVLRIYIQRRINQFMLG